MVLIFHILVAFGSLAFASAAAISPSKEKLKITYLLASSMFASGSYLVIKNTSHLLEACIMGLAFLAILSVEVSYAQRKLAGQLPE